MIKVARQPSRSNKSKTTHARTKPPTLASTRAEPWSRLLQWSSALILGDLRLLAQNLGPHIAKTLISLAHPRRPFPSSNKKIPKWGHQVIWRTTMCGMVWRMTWIYPSLPESACLPMRMWFQTCSGTTWILWLSVLILSVILILMKLSFL